MQLILMHFCGKYSLCVDGSLGGKAMTSKDVLLTQSQFIGWLYVTLWVGWSCLWSMGLELGLGWVCSVYFLFLLRLAATLTYSSHGESPECKRPNSAAKAHLKSLLVSCHTWEHSVGQSRLHGQTQH